MIVIKKFFLHFKLFPMHVRLFFQNFEHFSIFFKNCYFNPLIFKILQFQLEKMFKID